MAQPDELKCVTSHTINGEQDDSGANKSKIAYVTCQRIQPLPNRSASHKLKVKKHHVTLEERQASRMGNSPCPNKTWKPRIRLPLLMLMMTLIWGAS
jgi:hypothetical protein